MKITAGNASVNVNEKNNIYNRTEENKTHKKSLVKEMKRNTKIKHHKMKKKKEKKINSST